MKKLTSLIFCALLILSLVGCGKAKFEGILEDTAWVQSIETVYFIGREDGLYSIGLNGSNLKRLVMGQVTAFQLSDSGDKIAYERNYNEAENRECRVYDLTTGENMLICHTCSDIDFSPDGNHVSYSVGDHCIYEFDLIKQQTTLLVNSKDVIVGPRWSKTGALLYYNTLFEAEYYSINVINHQHTIVGKGVPFEYRKPGGKHPSWPDFVSSSKMHFNQSSRRERGEMLSHNKSEILFTVRGSLVVRSTTTQTERIVLENIGAYNHDFGPHGVANPIWSADNNFAIVELNDQLLVVDVSSGKAGVLAEGKKPLVWVPDYYPTIERVLLPMYYMYIK